MADTRPTPTDLRRAREIAGKYLTISPELAAALRLDDSSSADTPNLSKVHADPRRDDAAAAIGAREVADAPREQREKLGVPLE